tara:strand:+ start:471 stop:803 length:333 start_codon:yes stop_codon:yes gene_type:complete
VWLAWLRGFMEDFIAREKRKRALSREICKPGWEWNEAIGKCVLPYAAVGPAPSMDGPGSTEEPESTPNASIEPTEDAIGAEKNKRRAKAQKSAQNGQQNKMPVSAPNSIS